MVDPTNTSRLRGRDTFRQPAVYRQLLTGGLVWSYWEPGQVGLGELQHVLRSHIYGAALLLI